MSNLSRGPPSPALLEHRSEPFSVSPSPAARNKKSHSRRREVGYVPRPRNSFIVFRSWWIAKQRASDNGAGEGQQNELSKLAGKAWRQMSEEDKQGFIEVSNEEQQRHKIEHPNYQYTPTPRHTPSASRSKPKASMRKAGGASRKRRAAERYSSPSPGPSTEPESPGFIPSHRDVRIPRAAAQAAAHRLEKMASEFLPSVSPPTPQIPLALHHSPAAQGVAPEYSPIMEEAEEEEFVPIDQIPPLMLDPQARTEDVEMVVESKPEEPTFVTDFPPGLNYSGEQFGLRSTFFNPYTHIPTLPNVTLADLQEMQSEGLDRSYILERPLSPLEDAGYLGLQPPAVNIIDLWPRVDNGSQYDFIFDYCVNAPAEETTPLQS